MPLVVQDGVRVDLPVDSLLCGVVATSSDPVGLGLDLVRQVPVVLLVLRLLHLQTFLPAQREFEDGVRDEVGSAFRHEQAITDGVWTKHEEKVGQVGNTDTFVGCRGLSPVVF